MGAGKSTIGRILANELQLTFVDSDKEIEDRAGANIPWIFDMEGEIGFRKREASVIDELTQLTNIVLATGGGAVLGDDNRRFLQARGTVIYLHASLQQQIERTAKDRNRPLLQTENPSKVLSELMHHRDPLYQGCCDLLIHTDGRRPKSVAKDIIRQLEQLDILR
jgi:shikimate kinase